MKLFQSWDCDPVTAVRTEHGDHSSALQRDTAPMLPKITLVHPTYFVQPLTALRPFEEASIKITTVRNIFTTWITSTGLATFLSYTDSVLGNVILSN